MQRLAGLGLALLLLAGCGGTSTRSAGPPGQGSAPSRSPSATTADPAHLTTRRCADLVVLGLRGQGQSVRGHHGVGREVDGVARAMLARLPDGTDERIEGVPFPARSGGDAAYSMDVRTGVRLVADRLAEVRRKCPRSEVGLVGYSQGAEVVHRSAATAGADGLAVVVLMGDPLRHPADPVRTLRLGTPRLTGRGNGGAGARFPGGVRTRVLEVCAHDDDVCNAPLTGRLGPPSVTHRTFYKSRTVQRRVAVEAARVVVGSGG